MRYNTIRGRYKYNTNKDRAANAVRATVAYAFSPLLGAPRHSIMRERMLLFDRASVGGRGRGPCSSFTVTYTLVMASFFRYFPIYSDLFFCRLSTSGLSLTDAFPSGVDTRAFFLALLIPFP